MKLSHIRDVIAIAERGSLRAAARHLGIAQPAMTRSIRELELELGATLFERSASGVTLTPIGEAFVRRVTSVQHELDRARDEVAQMTGRSTGTISVGLSTAPHMGMLARVLPAFRSRYPNVKLDLIEGLFPSMEAQLREGEIDFYVGPSAEDRLSGEFSVETLIENTRVVLGRRGHPLRHACTLAELADAEWVTTSVTIDHDAELRPVFEEAGMPMPNIAVHARSGLTMIAVAASTDLLALVPRQWLDFAGRTGLLEHIAIREQLRAPALRIIHRARLPLTPIAQHLCDLFRRAALNS